MTARALLIILIPINVAMAAANFALGDPGIGVLNSFAARVRVHCLGGGLMTAITQAKWYATYAVLNTIFAAVTAVQGRGGLAAFFGFISGCWAVLALWTSNG